MDNNLLEIKEYDGLGYKPLIDYGTWRVAFLRYIDELIPDRIEKLERHVETDEVFVLLQGQAVLFLGEGDEEIKHLHSQNLVIGKLYNVKRNAWHTCVLSKDATIMLVENQDTGDANTDFFELNAQQRSFIVEIVQSNIPEWRDQGS